MSVQLDGFIFQLVFKQGNLEPAYLSALSPTQCLSVPEDQSQPGLPDSRHTRCPFMSRPCLGFSSPITRTPLWGLVQTPSGSLVQANWKTSFLPENSLPQYLTYLKGTLQSALVITMETFRVKSQVHSSLDMPPGHNSWGLGSSSLRIVNNKIPHLKTVAFHPGILSHSDFSTVSFSPAHTQLCVCTHSYRSHGSRDVFSALLFSSHWLL